MRKPSSYPNYLGWQRVIAVVGDYNDGRVVKPGYSILQIVGYLDMFGKRPCPIRLVLVAQLLILNGSPAIATLDSDWLRVAQSADDLRQRGDYRGSRDRWVEALKQADSNGSLNPWTTVALRNITEHSINLHDIDLAEKYSIRYVAELEKRGEAYPELAHALLIRGRVLALRNQFGSSIECLVRGLKIAREEPVDVSDRSEALTFLSANYEVLNLRDDSNRCQKELVDTLLERRGSTAWLLLRLAAERLRDISKHLPAKEEKCYLRVSRNLYERLATDPTKFGYPDGSVHDIFRKMSDISQLLGEPKRSHSELTKAKIACLRNSRMSDDQRAVFLAQLAASFNSAQLFIEAAQCFNLAKKFSGGKKFTDGWYLNRQAGEAQFRNANFKQAKASFLESIFGAKSPTERSYSFAFLCACELQLDNTKESDRYLKLAIQEALNTKRAAKESSLTDQENLAFIRNGFNQITVTFWEKHNPKAAARVHAFGLSLVDPTLYDVAGEYLWQGALEHEARNITNAEKNMDNAFILAKYSLDEPEVAAKNPETDIPHPDDRRWKFFEYYRLRGLCAVSNNDAKTAIKLTKRYLALRDNQKWILGRNFCNFNAAMVYLQVKMFKESRRLFREAIDFTDRHKDVKHIAEFRLTNFFYLAIASCEDGDFDAASNYCKTVVELSEKSADRLFWLPATDAIRGRIQSLQGNHKEAQDLFDKALTALAKRKEFNPQDYANVLYWQLQDRLAQNQVSKAQELAKEAISLYEKKNAHAFSYEDECRKILGGKYIRSVKPTAVPEIAYVDGKTIARPNPQVSTPPNLRECETSAETVCGDWIWDARSNFYRASWANGAKAEVRIEKRQSGIIILNRRDNLNGYTGFTARYLGKWNASKNKYEGEVQFSDQTHKWIGKWEATLRK